MEVFMIQIKSETTKTVLVFTNQMAKYLLRLRYQIIDIKPHRDGNNKTVYAFIDEENIREKIKEYNENLKNVYNTSDF
jgi:hypothetical protein